MIELRHKEWIRESVFEGLEKRKAGIVFCDMPMCHLAQMSIISTHANDAKRRMPQLKNLPDGTVMGTLLLGKMLTSACMEGMKVPGMRMRRRCKRQ